MGRVSEGEGAARTLTARAAPVKAQLLHNITNMDGTGKGGGRWHVKTGLPDLPAANRLRQSWQSWQDW
ncbi:protein of unknown function [Cupriavidus taiwanensis]|nr:protein of unknown function [Cupriavidus taiwanensis]